MSTECSFLTPDDRVWIEEVFHWISSGYTLPKAPQLVFGPADFPVAHTMEKITVEDLLSDLCTNLSYKPALFEVEWFKDVTARDWSILAPVGLDEPLEAQLLVHPDRVLLVLAESLQQRPDRLLAQLAIQCTNFQLHAELGPDDDSTDIIITAAVFFGFGVVLANGLSERWTTAHSAGGTETTTQLFPPEYLMYAMALDALYRGDTEPAWRNDLPLECRHYFDKSIEVLTKHGPALEQQVVPDGPDHPESLFQESCRLAESGDIDGSNEVLQKLLFVDSAHASIYYNNLGYNLLRSARYQESLCHFRNAIKTDPGFPYPYNNLGLALIMTGNHEEGKRHLETARDMDGSHDGYYYRNLGIYHSQKAEYDQACSCFRQARSFTDVDDLDFYQGLHLCKRGMKQEGVLLLQGAAAYGCRKATAVLEELA